MEFSTSASVDAKYREGLLADSDDRRRDAFVSFSSAAARGHRDAMFRVAVCYGAGLGVARSAVKAAALNFDRSVISKLALLGADLDIDLYIVGSDSE